MPSEASEQQKEITLGGSHSPHLVLLNSRVLLPRPGFTPVISLFFIFMKTEYLFSMRTNCKKSPAAHGQGLGHISSELT